MTVLDSQGNVLTDESSCAGVRADLKNCLLDSDCVVKVPFLKITVDIEVSKVNDSLFNM